MYVYILIVIDETPSDILLKITLDHVPVDVCNRSYPLSDNDKLTFGILPESMICAGSMRDNEDTCQVCDIVFCFNCNVQ